VVTEVEILNEILKIELDNTYQIALTIITLILAGITFLGVVLTNKNTKKALEKTAESNNLLRMEIENKLRPNILFQEKKMSFSPKNQGKTTINAGFINIGSTPAKNFRYYIYPKSTKIDLDDLMKNQEIIKQKEKKTMGLLPTDFVEVVNTVIDVDSNTSKDFWCAFWMVYDFLDVRDYEYIIILHHKGNDDIEQFFFDDDQIKESRKRGGHSPGL
jgi:hypothetical protein